MEVYEGEWVMCVKCGRIGHTLRNCTTLTPINPIDTNEMTTTAVRSEAERQASEWEIVSFPKRKKKTESQIPRRAGESKPNVRQRPYQVKEHDPHPGTSSATGTSATPLGGDHIINQKKTKIS
uniref:CCHC-type domain-containing protein n=1 Tax=Solanum tuberosum TaxID=4113 RepID=M1DRI7_SOLTU